MPDGEVRVVERLLAGDALRGVEVEQLREEVGVHKKRRVETFDALVKAQAEAGTGGRMAQYRKLISAGCGGVSPDEVDHVVKMLAEVRVSRLPMMVVR